MKILTLSFQVILGFGFITAVFGGLNAWGILGWQAMNTLWLFYPGFVAMVAAYFFSRNFPRPGAGILFAFCLTVPGILISNYFNLPWGQFFFCPSVMIIAGLLSIIGEGFNRIGHKKSGR